MPIAVAAGVKVSIQAARVEVQGPKGRLEHTLPRGITAKLVEDELIVERRNDSKQQRALHGLMRSLLANAVHGVSQGFSKQLEIHGVGYRADLAGQVLKLNVGYSHPVEFQVPPDVQVKIERNTRIAVSGCDRQKVGQVAADIRAVRPPDVYKQKGVRHAGESLRKKAGKSGAK
jgi:large subunit ribosomal protein L6